jgi:FKBP-type peptidyl-prolyl cis-trans isomerase FkpA
MKRIALIALSLAFAACKGGTGGGTSGSSGAPPQNDDEKTFYALGRAMGRGPAGVFDMNEREVELVKQGLGDQLLNKPSDIKIEEYGPKFQQLAMARSAKKAEKEKVAGAAFAEKAAKEPGAEKLPSGVIVRITQQGTGEQPKETDTVKVHYEGTLENGTVFDSSKKRGQPATFPLKGVIPCWTEGVQKLKVGGKAVLTCPSATAYGDRGSPPTIPGGATLRFEVELLGIETGAAAPGAPAITPAPHGVVPGAPKTAPKH